MVSKPVTSRSASAAFVALIYAPMAILLYGALFAAEDRLVTICIYVAALCCLMAAGLRWRNGLVSLRDSEARLQEQSQTLDARTVELAKQQELLADYTESLQVASKRYEDLFQNLPVACFTFDSGGSIFEWNRACEALYGWKPEETFQQSVWSVLFMPEDEPLMRELIRQVYGGSNVPALEVQQRTKEGETIDVLTSIFPIRAADGSVVGAICANTDISMRKAAERERDQFFNLSLDMLAVADVNGVFKRVNPAFGKTLGWSQSELVNCPIQEYVHEEDRALTEQAIARLLESSEGDTFECRFKVKDGSYKWLSWSSPPPLPGSPSLFLIARDVTEQKLAAFELESKNTELLTENEQLSTLATTDGLTGLANKRAFTETLTEAFRAAVKSGNPLSVLVIDVDKFKSYNDEFGHPAGDEALAQVAGALSSGVRDGDMVARYGGEEFAVILPKADRGRAMDVGERLRALVESREWPLRPVTVSVGVSTLSTEIKSEGELVEIADKALYHSKASGRNRVTHAAALSNPAA